LIGGEGRVSTQEVENNQVENYITEEVVSKGTFIGKATPFGFCCPVVCVHLDAQGNCKNKTAYCRQKSSKERIEREGSN